MAIPLEDQYRVMRGAADLVYEVSQEASGPSRQWLWTRERDPSVLEKVCPLTQATYASLKMVPEGRPGIRGHAAGAQDVCYPHLSVPRSQFYPSNR